MFRTIFQITNKSTEQNNFHFIINVSFHQRPYKVQCLQVQPDMEELTENAEEGGDEAESKQSEVKLGKLQYKVNISIIILCNY